VQEHEIGKSGGMAMMRAGGSETNVVIAKYSQVSSGALVQVDYPDAMTNRLEMMISFRERSGLLP
jgi:hypothetical protein